MGQRPHRTDVEHPQQADLRSGAMACRARVTGAPGRGGHGHDHAQQHVLHHVGAELDACRRRPARLRRQREDGERRRRRPRTRPAGHVRPRSARRRTPHGVAERRPSTTTVTRRAGSEAALGDEGRWPTRGGTATAPTLTAGRSRRSSARAAAARGRTAARGRRPTTASHGDGSRARVRWRDPLAVGVVVWLASELMFFAGLFAAYFALRSANDDLAARRASSSTSSRAGVFTVVLLVVELHHAPLGPGGRGGRPAAAHALAGRHVRPRRWPSSSTRLSSTAELDFTPRHPRLRDRSSACSPGSTGCTSSPGWC